MRASTPVVNDEKQRAFPSRVGDPGQGADAAERAALAAT